MKWFSNRLTYPLVIFAIAVSVVLQLAWVYQLYLTQEFELRKDLESTISASAKISTYLSTMPGHADSQGYRDFMLSDEWMQLRHAYDNLRFNHIKSNFQFQQGSDSTHITLRLRFANNSNLRVKVIPKLVTHYYDKSFDEVLKQDRNDQIRMDSILKSQMRIQGLEKDYGRALYTSNQNNLTQPNLASEIKSAAYKSEKYPYNVRYVNTYQVFIKSLFQIVVFRMRFYLLSSFFTLSLTCAVFYFLLRLMRDQRLYAQARLAFTSNMTHELKTPVATVVVALQSIRKFKLFNQPAKLEKYLDISEKELNRLTLMIEKVLNLEQVDNGIIRMRPELYDVQQGLQEVVSAMLIQVESTNSKIIYRPSVDPCFINGDPIHLTNAFYNLIDNALKFGGENVTVDIACSCVSENVIICFQDNGPGIAPIYQDKIFDRFFRIQENENIQTTKGSGLGLNYVKSIITQLGGKIELQSQPGKGSKFIINLPIYHEE